MNKIGPTPQCRESATRSERCKASSSASSMSSAAHRAFLDGFRVGMGNDADESFVTQLFVGESLLVVPLIRGYIFSVMSCPIRTQRELMVRLSKAKLLLVSANSAPACLLEPVQKWWRQAVRACVWTTTTRCAQIIRFCYFWT